MTRSELLAARQAAGEAYRRAAEAYLEAYVQLAAYDAACSNRHFGLGTFGSFSEVPKVVLHQFYLEPYAGIVASQRINPLVEQLVNSVTPEPR